MDVICQHVKATLISPAIVAINIIWPEITMARLSLYFAKNLRAATKAFGFHTQLLEHG